MKGGRLPRCHGAGWPLMANTDGQHRTKKAPKEGETVLPEFKGQQTKICKELLVENNGSPDDIFYLICFYKVKECCNVAASLNLKAGDQDGTL